MDDCSSFGNKWPARKSLRACGSWSLLWLIQALRPRTGTVTLFPRSMLLFIKMTCSKFVSLAEWIHPTTVGSGGASSMVYGHGLGVAEATASGVGAGAAFLFFVLAPVC